MSKDESSSEIEEIRGNDIRVSAMTLLARREHSRAELFNKLVRRFPDAEKVEFELNRLEQEGLQSDLRFVNSFISSRVGRYQGSLKIRQELKRFDLDEMLITRVFDEMEIDWPQLAFEAAQRKFSNKNLSLRRERDRARQFLYRRGFETSVCVRAIEQLASDSDD